MSGFRAIHAETRGDRQCRGDKEALEKERLKGRREAFGRYHDPGPLTENTPGSLGYASRAERFQTDAAAELKKNRDAVVQAREELLSVKRERNLTREENRWKRADEEFNEKLERQASMANGAKGSQNHSSIAYDPITLEYHETPAGQKQKYEDDLTRFRAGVRTEKLHRQNSGSGYNPITVSVTLPESEKLTSKQGEDLRAPVLPPKPRYPN
ncbi:hypothetical protein GUITHDRAFT_135420 [Guillardia theta CCMP2712]|uniref:Uncharacterized protein n=1 Tax=Guillardia theta (strain CCMP2712) TaxID=905079 RepID=L1JQA6_GUITC|nr:hypothetical protein GUITHDRAFT_135420 [Guillardia theta CCMP2712]EKX50258.1 hypothetical protein GUITHDRAFT_135420 [Guillardia theta CCMP2712]|eukprot:XP_005837238.1 hypothetical protein GUITHDRAFT_135420 [Guillardia theta CCMP2712]